MKPIVLKNGKPNWIRSLKKQYNKNMTLISGIPPWMQMYFDRLNTVSGKRIKDLFPNFSVLVHGGVNFEPYKDRLLDSIGKPIDTIETYPASEGFFAFQDSRKEEGLLLNTNSGIFFEFIPAEEIFNENPTRISLKDVKTGVNYALIISNNAGLWGYNIGDTIRFLSSGSISHCCYRQDQTFYLGIWRTCDRRRSGIQPDESCEGRRHSDQ